MHRTFYYARFHQAYFAYQKVEVVKKWQTLSFSELDGLKL